MNPFIQDFVKKIHAKIGKQPKVLEIGSMNFNGGVRQYFKDSDIYIGVDANKGRGVDMIMPSYDIPKHFEEGYFDCVICLETLEHDPYFWVTLSIMKKMLKKDGWMIISTPSLYQGIHECPQDYYRFMPDTYTNIFFNGFNNGEIVICGCKIKGSQPYVVEEGKPVDYTKIVTIIGYGQKN